MKHIAPILLILSLATVPAKSEQPTDLSQGMELLNQGTELLLRGLMKEFEPKLRELEGALKDLSAYHSPELLPNGDIIIRRKTPVEIPENSEIDL